MTFIFPAQNLKPKIDNKVTWIQWGINIDIINCFHIVTGPYITSGKIGNAIYTPNVRANDNNTIDLGSHQGDCFGMVWNCPDGATLSLWFKTELPTYSHDLTMLFKSSTMTVIMEEESGSFELRPNLHLNATHHARLRGFPPVTPGEWHHLGITYSLRNGFEVFFDGCKSSDITSTVTPKSLTVVDIMLGCQTKQEFRYCPVTHYDDLRFWTALKSDRFMWWLWKMWCEELGPGLRNRVVSEPTATNNAYIAL